MATTQFQWIKAAWDKAFLKVLLVFITLVLIGWPAVSQYGLSVDEPTEIAMVRRNYELIKDGTPIPGDLRFFGTAFNFTVETLFQIKEFVNRGGNYNPANYQAVAEDDTLKLQALADRVIFKHYCTFLVSLLAYAAVAGCVGILCGWEFAWLGPIILALFPLFWGQSFFNPKDVPFAAIFIVCTYLGSYLLNHYLQINQRVKFKWNPTNLYSFLFGIAVGVLTSIRIGGFFFLFFIAATHLILAIPQKNIFRTFYNLLIPYILMVVAWMATTTILQPAAWRNPVGWFIETISYLSKHPLPLVVFFNQKVIPIQELPRSYIPTLVIKTLPEILLLFSIIGLIALILKYKHLSNVQRACFCLLCFEIFFIPLVAIIKDSSAYDGIRHFMFIMPALAAIATTGILWSYQRLPKKSFRLFFIGLISAFLVQISFDMIALHPYEYIYFNRLFAGGLETAAKNYDTEYWGLSLREGMEWINKQAKPRETVIVGGHFYSARIYADPELNLNLLEYEPLKKKGTKIPEPFYYLAWPRWNARTEFPQCPVIHQVSRQNVPLSIVKRCG